MSTLWNHLLKNPEDLALNSILLLKILKKKIKHNKVDSKSECSIWLDCVEGEDNFGRLPANEIIRFIFAFENNYGDNIGGITNGFHIYSYDGATWYNTYPDTLNSLDWENSFNQYFQITAKSIDGMGADSVKFMGIADIFGGGLPFWFNDTAISIQIGPISPEHIGKTICLDSCTVAGSNNWGWSSLDGIDYLIPEWYGPYCFEVSDPKAIYFTGQLLYQDPTPPDTTYEPIRNIFLVFVDYDPFFNDDTLCIIQTDNSGYFDTGPIISYDFCGPDIYVRIVADNEAAIIVKAFPNSDSGHVVIYTSDTVDNVASGDHSYDKLFSVEDSKTYFAADAILEGYQDWKEIYPEFDTKCTVILSSDRDTNCYWGGKIYINDSLDVSLPCSNIYSKGTILHEYGHFLSGQNLFFRHGGGGHSITTFYDIGTASSEAWAHFWSAYSRDTCTYIRYFGNFEDSTYNNWENGAYLSGSLFFSFNAMGQDSTDMNKFNEGSIAGVFWDIYDSHDDDYSSRADWNTLNLGPNPDGIGDTLTECIEAITYCLLDTVELYGRHPMDMNEFWEVWFKDGQGYRCQAMKDIFYEHGINKDLWPDPCYPGCCSGIRGNFDYDPEDIINVVDLTALVGYIFGGGEPPVCWDEGNVDGDPDDKINVVDLTYIVGYIFRNEPQPPPCNSKEEVNHLTISER